MATRRDKNPGTIDALDIALASERDSGGARVLIEKQSRLIDSQETLTRADLRHRGWQIIGERVGALLKALTVCAGVALLAGIIAFFWSANRASGMVVDPFSVPPDLDRQGMTGAVVARQLLDKVSTLEAATQSARARSSYDNSFSDSKGVVVPYAGVSLGELRREARDWLGSETHLSGEVVRLAGNRLSVSFRATGGVSGSVEGSAQDSGKLLDQAALAIFKATQPYRYSVYRSRRGEGDEAIATLRQLARSDNLRERLWALHGLALDAPSQAETVAIYRRALALDSNFLPAIGNMPIYELNDGHEEVALKGLERSSAAYSKGAPDYTRDHGLGFALDMKVLRASLRDDFRGAAVFARQAENHGAGPGTEAGRLFITPEMLARAHDFPAAREALAGSGLLDPGRRAQAEQLAGPQFNLVALQAIATGDEAGIAAAYRRAVAALGAAAPINSATHERSRLAESLLLLRPPLALALARSGALAEARAEIAPAPDDYDAALRVRALIAAFSGDVRASDAMFARAVARTPSLPAAHLMWAEAKLARGDSLGAEAQAKEAVRLSPNSANALYLCGEALLAQNRADEAAQSFARAAKVAPVWGRLNLKYASALWMSGKRGDALARLRAAAAMALSPADRAHLRLMQANARRPRA